MILLLLWQFVVGTTSQEEGLDKNSDINHVRGGMVESRDNHVRGDNILPESDYDYSQFIPTHNDFMYHDSDHTPSQESVYEDPICWSPQCAREGGGDDIRCMACPDSRPVRKTDIDLTVSCSPSGGVVEYNLTSVLGFGLENLTIVLSYEKEDEEDSIDMIEV